MTEHEQETFELQLRRIKAAKPPEAFTARLVAAEPPAKVAFEAAPPASPVLGYLRMLRGSLRWLIPATAVMLVAAGIWRGSQPAANQPSSPAPNPQTSAAEVTRVLNADDIKIDQQLVSSFEAVARLPGGEPMRFRCESWVDQLVLSDKSQGLVVENRSPRFEVVALGFDSY